MALCIGTAGLVSCEISDQELGQDLLPPGDEIFLFHDTVFDIHATTITSLPVVSSEPRNNPASLMLLGETRDTVAGLSVASLVTQVNTNPTFRSAPNLTIDSLMLFLRIQDYIGDTTQEITFSVYEFTQRIFIDSIYYSDFDPEGKYNPAPLVEKSFMPRENTTLEFRIEDPGFIQKFSALEDTTLIKNDSLFKDFFNGFYITARSNSPDGVIARLMPNHVQTLMSIKYATDSTQIDSTAGDDYVWGQFSIERINCQKINVFRHDYSGTSLAGIMDRDDSVSTYCYVQGMGGVNTRFSFSSLDEWLERSPVAITSARLVFNVVPEDESGIPYDDLPGRLMIATLLDNGSDYEPVYDYWLLYNNDLDNNFGGYKKAVSEGLFYDTTYSYQFNIGLHFQTMVDGTKPDNDFLLRLYDGNTNPKITKIWGNLPAPTDRIRLEVVYLKLD